MLAIRLRRTGAKKNAHYRVVVTDRAAGRDGRFLEVLGHYHPRSRPLEVSFNVERTEEWLSKGAQMSDTVRSLYKMVRTGTLPTEEAAPAPKAAPAPTPEPEENLEAAAEVEATEEGAAEVESDEAAAEEADADGGEEE